jgi:KUP system potassium uptake protein
MLAASCAIVTLLILSQRFGTSKVLKFYGPIMVAWFCIIAGVGIYNIWNVPTILRALSPHYFFSFAVTYPKSAFITLGQA